MSTLDAYQCMNIPNGPLRGPTDRDVGGKCHLKPNDGADDDNDPPLDHTLYPHIIDDIIRFAPPHSLLKLRRTSREFRDRVDAVLSTHVVVADGRELNITPSSASSFLEVTPHMAPSLRPPLDLSQTRIVDLVGPVGARSLMYRCSGGKTGHELYLEYLASRFDKVDLVRFRSDSEGRGVSCCPFGPRSLIAFAKFAEPETSGYPSTAAVGPIPKSVERLVVNIEYEPASWWLSRASLGLWPVSHDRPNLTHVTIILSPRTSSRGCSRAYGECLGPPQWMGMLCNIVNLICYTISEVKYTLVGVDKLEPEWLGIEPDWHGTPPSTSSSMFDYRNDTVVHLVQDAMGLELKRRHDWDIDEVDEALQNVRFITRAQYESERIPRQFELETVQ